jgi:preprotein translocase subunit SecD
VAPPSTKSSRPGRILAALLALFVVLLASVIGKNALHPASWHRSFKVGLGLDLSSGTTVTLRAVTSKPGQVPSQASMKIADGIMLSRLNGSGLSGAQVQQQGTDILTVSVPGKGSQQVEKLVGTTAQMRFRQVLLRAPGFPEQVTIPAPGTPGATPAPGASPTASPSSSASASASPKASPSPSASQSNGTSQAARARRLTAAGRAAGAHTPKPRSSPKATGKATATPTPTPAPSATPTVRTVLPTTAQAQGDPSLSAKPCSSSSTSSTARRTGSSRSITVTPPNGTTRRPRSWPATRRAISTRST